MADRYFAILITISCILILVILYLTLLKSEQYEVQIEEQQNKIQTLENKIDYLHGTKTDLKKENLDLLILISAYKLSTVYEVEITAYTARPQETNNDPTNTAIMQKPIPGWTIAVSWDLRHLLGTRVYVPGYGVRYVNDVMNERHTMRIDILVGTVEQAEQIGLQKGELILLEPYLVLKEIFTKDFLYAYPPFKNEE